MIQEWAVVSSRPHFPEHLEELSAALTRAGVENAVQFIPTTDADLHATIDKLKASGVKIIRLEGSLASTVLSIFPNAPSNLRLLSAADSIQFDEKGQEWMRNHLYDAFSRFIAHDIKIIDFNGAAFVVGLGAEARAIVSCLARTGFTRILVTDQNSSAGEVFVNEVRRSHFNVDIRFIPRSEVMHLPGVHSFAVNTVCVADDEGKLVELSYFNFLKPGAFWVELPCANENASLIQEARNAGAIVHRGLDVMVHTDYVWAQSCFKCSLDMVQYRDDLEKRVTSEP